MKSLIILGAGGHGKVVAESALATNKYKNIYFLDDKFIQKESFSKVIGLDIIGDLNLAEELINKKSFSKAIVAIGNSWTRIKWLKKLKYMGYEIPTIIHPNAWISPSSIVNEGTVVFAQAVIQSSVSIGFGSIVNTSSSIDHDSIIGEGVHICPGARIAGGVKIGSNSIIGIGSSINEGLKIGNNVMIGAGSAVVKNLGNNLIAKGVPAKVDLDLNEN